MPLDPGLPVPDLSPVPPPPGEPKTDTFRLDAASGKTWRVRVVKTESPAAIVSNGSTATLVTPPGSTHVSVGVCLVGADMKPVVDDRGRTWACGGDTLTFTDMNLNPDLDPAAEIRRVVNERVQEATLKIEKQALLDAALAEWSTPTGIDPTAPS